MRRCLLLAAAAAGALSLACSAATRYRVLSRFFDGVPAPRVAAAEAAAPATSEPGVTRRVALLEHGPYGAKLCGACHERGTNALVVPAEELCRRCHELASSARFVHGPLEAGGCRACHEPHSSRFRYLLVSESDGSCLGCHSRADLSPIQDHAGQAESCTVCHDPHMSDRQYLLR